jgi:hypothetical protein
MAARRRIHASTAGQRGFALIALLAMLTAGVLYFIVNRMDAAATHQARDKRTAEALNEAKAAIIAWSATNSTAPGRLPCPEDTSRIGTLTEGQALSTCSNSTTVIGRLPWRTLGIEAPLDGYGEPLWYALSAGFRNSPINADTPAQLSLDGASAAAVAVVFAPGPALAGQVRPAISAASPPVVSNYLDLTNGDSDSTFATTGDPASFNDKLLPVTHEDLFAAVGNRVAGEVVRSLLIYFCGDSTNIGPNQNCLGPGGARNLPRPAAMSDTTCLGNGGLSATDCMSDGAASEGRIPANPATPWTTYETLSLLRGTTGSGNWFQSNGWRELIYMAVSTKCLEPAIDCSGGGSYLSVDGVANVKVAIIATGGILSGQTRSTPLQKGTLANYLEGENKNLARSTFASGYMTSSFNDLIRAIR